MRNFFVIIFLSGALLFMLLFSGEKLAAFFHLENNVNISVDHEREYLNNQPTDVIAEEDGVDALGRHLKASNNSSDFSQKKVSRKKIILPTPDELYKEQLSKIEETFRDPDREVEEVSNSSEDTYKIAEPLVELDESYLGDDVLVLPPIPSEFPVADTNEDSYPFGKQPPIPSNFPIEEIDISDVIMTDSAMTYHEILEDPVSGNLNDFSEN